MKIGVISDTHNFLDSRIPALFAGVQHILHGGDIGLPKLLQALRQIAPVTAVSGNTDDPALRYRPTHVLELAGRKFLVYHIVNPRAPSEPVRKLLAEERPDVVVFGHTHKPFNEVLGGILFLNPGYAGKSRFGLPRSVAILHCTKTGIRAELQSLS